MATAPKLRATTPGAQGNLFGVPVDNTDYQAMDTMERARQARANPMMPGAGQPTQQLDLPFNEAQRPATVGGAARTAAAGTGSALARGAAFAGRAMTGPVGAVLGTVVPAMIGAADHPALAGLGGVDDPSGGFVDYSAHAAAPAGPAGYRGQSFNDPRIVTPAPQVDPNALYQGMTPANSGPVAPRPAARPVARPAARPAARPVAAAPQQLFAPGVGDDSRARAMQYLRDQGLMP